MTAEETKIIDLMQNYGGSFCQALAAAFVRADPENFARLKAAFQDYWDKYAALAELRQL